MCRSTDYDPRGKIEADSRGPWNNAARSRPRPNHGGLHGCHTNLIPAWTKTEKADARLELNLAELDLAPRRVNSLEEDGMFTVRDLLNRTPEQVLKISNIGERTLETICLALERIGHYRTSRPPVEPMNRPPPRD